MAREITFYLKGNIVYYSYYAADGRASGTTKMRVDPEKFKAETLPKAEKSTLRRMQTVIDNYESETRLAGRTTRAAEVKILLAESVGAKPPPPPPARDRFLDIFNRYIIEVEKGNILKDGRHYSESYIRIACAVKLRLKELPLATIPANQVREEDLRGFVNSLTTAGLTRNTVSSYSGIALSAFNSARRLGWFDAPVIDNSMIRVGNETVGHRVYLDPAEQLELQQMELEGSRSYCRDAFLLGCQLGMRFSDLSRLTRAHRKGQDGRLVNINTRKTGQPVWVPLSSAAAELWKRLGDSIALPTLQTFKTTVRDLAKELFKQQVLFSRTEGGTKIERWVEKWELIGSHTMRRSFATNAYKAGVPMPSIMKVTGHRTTESFLRYICLTDEEHAQMLLDHPYFK